MPNLKIKPRKSLEEVQSYKLKYLVEKMKDKKFLKIDANENTHDLPEAITTLIQEAMKNIQFSQYPDPLSTSLCEKIGKRLGVSKDNVLVCNGSDDALGLIAHCFFGKKIAIPTYSYPVYYHLAKINEMAVIDIPLTAESFSLPLDMKKIFSSEKPEIVFFAYPNNPTGNLYDKETILSLTKEFPEILFIIDEAYFDFCKETFLPASVDQKNIIVLRTLSKAYGLAGLRVGFAVAHEALIELLQKVKLPYNMSLVSQQIVDVVYEPIQKFVEQTVASICEERDGMASTLSKIEGLHVFPSATNFLFVRLPLGINKERFIKSFENDNIQVRVLEYGSKIVYWRLTVGAAEENKRIIASIEAALAAGLS